MAKKKSAAGDVVVGIDLGGTKILAAVVDGEGRILGQAKRKTKAETGVEGVVTRIVETLDEAVMSAKLTRKDIRAIGIGAPGPVDNQTGVIATAPNLPGWSNVPLGELMQAQAGIPAAVDNDVNVGALGEFTYGAGRGTSDMVSLFVGTGIGGGIILNGQLRTGARGAAGEIGHMIVLADGPYCGCGNRGCIEALASRTAIVESLQRAVAAGRQSSLASLLAEGGQRLSSGGLSEAWRAGDPLTVEVLGRVQHYLGLHVASIVNLLDPEIIVFGGGVIEALGEAFVAPIRPIAYQHFLQRRDADRVRIVVSQLGDNAGILGAAVLARQRVAETA
jgi:glucokinase